MKLALYSTASPPSPLWLYSFTQRGTNSEIFEACIFDCIGVRIVPSNTNSLAIEVSSEKALELQLTCEIHHKTTFSKSDSFVHFKEQSLICY